MSKRLATLEALVEKGSADAFVHYGLAMEYRSEGRTEDALRVFAGLRRDHADYLPMYLLCGQLLASESRAAEARDWFEAGLALAVTKGDAKAKSELTEALADL